MSATWPRGVTLRPLSTWPGKRTTAPVWSSFKASWSSTLDVLDRELHQLNAKDVVLELGYREQDLRLDGLPRANARMVEQGVILDLGKSKHGPLRYPCDRFTDWQDNVRAIALALESLRRVDRYGVTSHGEQYAGWKAIGSGPATAMPGPADPTTAASDLRLFLRDPGVQGYESLDPSGLVRIARRHAHPDTGGSSADFHRVQAAAAALGIA